MQLVMISTHIAKSHLYFPFLIAYFAQQLVTLVLCIGSCAWLMCLMKRLHRYEYNRQFKRDITFALALILNMGFYIFLYSNSKLCFGSGCNSVKVGSDAYVVLRILSVFNVSEVFFLYTVLQLKKPCDCLEGVSKLDNLLLVSIFQKSNVDNPNSTLRTEQTDYYAPE